MFSQSTPSTKGKRRAIALAIGTATAVLAGHALAEDTGKIFSVSGYGTLGVTHSTIAEGDYVGASTQPNGAGYSHDWDIGVDSKAGVQLDAKLNEQFSGVLQVVSQHRTNNTYGARIEWANVKYAITPDFSVRVGRTALPAFMVSDSRLVGYTNPWIRTPIETYNLVPVTNIDGIDASYRMHFESINNAVQLYYGKSSGSNVSATPFGTFVVPFEAKNIVGVTDTAERGAWTARVGMATANLSARGVEEKLKFYNLGVAYDPGTWFVQGELSKMDLPVLTQGQQAFYLTSGYRWDKFTPYATYSQTKPVNTDVLGNAFDQKTYSAGLRWDVMKNTAVKVQLDHVQLGTGLGRNGYYINRQAGFPSGGSGNVVSAAVDFVF